MQSYSDKVCFEKSKEGLWVRATLDKDEVVVCWHTRHVLLADRIEVIGSEDAVIDGGRSDAYEFSDPWVEAGRISANGLSDEATKGLMSHAVRLVAIGWGDSPEEVISWFDDLGSFRFLIGEYVVHTDGGMFDGLERSTIRFKERQDDEPVVGTAMPAGGAIVDFEVPEDALEDILRYLSPKA